MSRMFAIRTSPDARRCSTASRRIWQLSDRCAHRPGRYWKDTARHGVRLPPCRQIRGRWWVRAKDPTTLTAEYAAVARVSPHQRPRRAGSDWKEADQRLVVEAVRRMFVGSMPAG